jgi:hypothetical protein
MYQFSTPLASLGRGEVSVYNCPYLEYILISTLAPEDNRRNSPRESEALTASPAKKRNSTKHQLLSFVASEENKEREKEKQQLAHLQQQQRELQNQQKQLQQQQEHWQQQRDQLQQPVAMKNLQMCLVWLGQSGVLLNSYSDCKIIPFSSFYNFSGAFCFVLFCFDDLI